MLRIVLIAVLSMPAVVFAQGHGPVFGYATPTNYQGETSFDSALVVRGGDGAAQLTAREIITYGFTPLLQLSVTLPGVISNASLPPTRMVSGDDFEVKVGWRFHHQIKGVGKRFESTLFGSFIAPGPQTIPGSLDDLKFAPGVMIAAATGVASRSHYFWVGAGYSAFAARDGDKRPNSETYSAVYAYRPRAWRTEPDKWDWRLLVEMTGEHTGDFQRQGFVVPQSFSNAIFLGPSTLGVYRQYAIQAGFQWAVYQDRGALMPRENYRAIINFSYFLLSKHTD